MALLANAPKFYYICFMEKAKYTPITEYNKPKKTPTNFVNPQSVQFKTKHPSAGLKNAVKGPNFIKKQDESWEY